jgi:hypothetical protein
MTSEITLPGSLSRSIQRVSANISTWCAEHQVALGVGEMAAGAAMIAMGVKSGAIEIGANLLVTHTPLMNAGGLAGAIAGAATGAWVGSTLGAIGIAAAGTAIGIPAAIVILGSAAIFSLAGYALGDVLHNYLTPDLDVMTLAGGGALLLAGTYLLIKGGRRLMREYNLLEPLKNTLSNIRDGLIILPSIAVEVVARTWEELDGFKAEWTTVGDTPLEVGLVTAGSAAMGAVGMATGGALAVSSVTVLGLPSLGGVAVALGLATPPLWPVLAMGALFTGIGYTAIKAGTFGFARKNTKLSSRS